MKGPIPPKMFSSHRCTYIDVSENGLTGTIPSEIGLLENLEVLRFQLNNLSGRIPQQMFNSRKMREFMIQSNELTGSVPTEIGEMKNVVTIKMNQNLLKSSIPAELSNLKQLKVLHTHMNKFTGKFPEIANMDSSSEVTANCHELEDSKCGSCTYCCDKNGNCKQHDAEAVRLYESSLIWFFSTPILVAIAIFVLFYLKQRSAPPILNYKPRDPLTIYNHESVYSYIFSESPVAWFIHFVIFSVQLALFFNFLMASDPKGATSLVSLSFVCPADTASCVSQEQQTSLGWMLFFVLTLLYIGTDIVNAGLQIRRSLFAEPIDFRLMLNGLSLMGLTTVSITSSFSYNNATASSDTDLIVNAVVLLFINDLDEQVITLLSKMFPEWNEARIAEISAHLTEREVNIKGKSFALDESSSGQESNYLSAQSEPYSPSAVSLYSNNGSTSFSEASLETSRNPSSFGIIATDGSIETKLHN